MLDKYLSFFSKYIESQLGIVYSEDNAYQLKTRLDEIIKIMGYADVQDLYNKSQAGIDGNLKQLLLDIATNNETYFYRDSRVFDVLAKYVAPKLISKNLGKPLRIWSAACSTGQEPYTISMCLREAGMTQNIEISATDISERALKKAISGVYTQLEVQRGLPITHLVKYFTKETENSWALKDEVKRNIQFKKFNLLDSTSQWAHPFDIIFCRNVLIYQRPEKKAEIISSLLKKLNPNGYIVFGPGESSPGSLMLKQPEKELQGTLIYQYLSNADSKVA